MTTFQRAWLYITRHKSKRRILCMILFVIITALTAITGIKEKKLESKKELENTSLSSFTLTSSKGEIPLEDAKKIASVNGISSYHYEKVIYTNLKGASPVTFQQTIQITDPSSPKNDVTLTGVSDSSLSENFTTQILTLNKGRHITPSDKDSVVIHEDFATANQLDIGSTFSLYTTNQKTKEVTVVGIYSGKTANNSIFPHEASENTIYTDFQTICSILDIREETLTFSSAKYGTDNRAHLDTIMKSCKTLPLDWEDYTLTNELKKYEDVLSSIENLEQMLTLLTTGLMIAGTVILSLILLLWIRGRISEIGILLSIGISKSHLILQFLIEIILLFVPCFLFSTPIVMLCFHISITSCLLSGIYCIGIILAAVLISSLTILMHSPKSILSRID